VRFASLESVQRSAAEALGRFPLPLGCAWVACAILNALIVGEGSHPRLIAAALMLGLGIPIFFALALFAERLPAGTPHAVRWFPQVAALLALVALAWVWPRWSNDVQWHRYLQLSLFAHALVAFLPYLAVREPNGFWQFNRTMFERFILASIFSAVLLLGLEGALASLKPLFGIRVSEKAYFLLTSWIWLIFHPWFFMAGMPADLASLEQRRDYPATLRIFAQFILVPLVAVYQVLLTSYLVRVIFTGKWPSGLIGWLVSAEATAGMLAILLVHPVREQAENVWVRTFSRGFYLALVPSIVMLALSISKRVGQYGITEDRYFVIALTVWLGAISCYFIVRRDGDIRWIPVTLAALALFTFAGPWSAYGVSVRSQRARLVRALEAHGLLKNGRYVHPSGPVPLEDRKRISTTLVYLLGVHGSRPVRPMLGEYVALADSGIADPEKRDGTERARRTLERMGIDFVGPWQTNADNEAPSAYSFSTPERTGATEVEGLDWYMPLTGPSITFTAGPRRLNLVCDEKNHREILWEDRTPQTPYAHAVPPDTLATADLTPMIQKALLTRDSIKAPERIEFAGPGARGFALIHYLAGNEGSGPRVYGMMGDLYFTLLRPAPDPTGAGPR
jgi:hypothetical protein